MIIPMLCVTIFVILVVWFLLPRVARLMIHTPTAIRSEERFSRNAETDLVCRLLLEKKNDRSRRPASNHASRLSARLKQVQHQLVYRCDRSSSSVLAAG